MMKACETGDIMRLKYSLDAVGVGGASKPTQRGIDTVNDAGTPATSDMLHRAVTYNQPVILKHLLKVYPSVHVASDVLLASDCANPDLSTLESFILIILSLSIIP